MSDSEVSPSDGVRPAQPKAASAMPHPGGMHPLWQPFDPAATAERAGARIASRQEPVRGIAPPRDWSTAVLTVTRLVAEALGAGALGLEHVGSTAVPGLWAKPILDLDLTVADSSDERTYLPALEAAGFRLIAREPEWEEHRCLTLADPNTNLHVFSVGAIEPQRHGRFRDRLRTHPGDRVEYEIAKRRARGFVGSSDGASASAGAGADADADAGADADADANAGTSVGAAPGPVGAPDYNAAKAGVIYDIYERIFADDAEYEHVGDPRLSS